MRGFRLWHRVRSGLWFVPVLCVVAGVAVSFLTIAIDRHANGGLVPRDYIGGPDAALMILGTVAASMVTLTGLVLTITMVVVQLAMGQFSPRIVRSILRDKPSQLAIGVFVGTFAHAMLAMREVRSTSDGAPVPGLAILVAFGLILLSIVVLVFYVNHIGQSLRVAALIELVGKDIRGLLDELYADAGHNPDEDVPQLVLAPKSGVVFRVGHQALVALAREAGCTLYLLRAVGDFVPAGAPLFRVEGGSAGTPLKKKKVVAAVALGPERAMYQDVGYGLRMLVDIAVRSLSDSMDDPTTAVQAIDRLHDCLRQLARRPFPSGEHADDDGRTRLVVPTMNWEGYVRLAFDEIMLRGRRSPQVSRRLAAALEDLRSIAPADRQAALDLQLRRLEDPSEDVEDDRFRTTVDQQGIGSGADLVRR